MNALTLFARLMAEGSPAGGNPKRRHKRNFYQSVSPNVDYFDQGQPWLRKESDDDYEYDDYGSAKIDCC